MAGRRVAITLLAAGLLSGTTVLPALADTAARQPRAHDQEKSSPPDRTIYGPVTGRLPVKPVQRAAGVFVIDATAAAKSAGGNEPGIAINPADPEQIAISRFHARWNGNADLLYSADGGKTWSNETSIPVPPGVTGTSGCPCDQTIDYGRHGTLYGTFLTHASVVTGSTSDPTKAASWSWNGNPAQLTTGTRTNVDQPWLVVNRDPTKAGQDDAYVGYDDFSGGPDMRVAVSYGAHPVNITADNKAGTAKPLVTNPGLRLAADPRNGTMYALYEQSSGSNQPKSVTYKLNRSTDGGVTWTLNGDANGITVATVNSDQSPGFKFGGVNALLGGVDHLAVDPRNGDVYVVYGQDVAGGNQLKIRRLTPNGSGGLAVGPASDVSTSTDAALPSVAVTSGGTVGVLYDTFDGKTTAGFPIFSAHLARSGDQGATFSDIVLQRFQSPVTEDPNAPRQRILGDFQQLKAVGQTFYGTFPGNTSGVPATKPPIDAMFFTAQEAAVTRTVTFVHGINGNFLNFQCSNLAGGFAAILAQVCADPAFAEESFPYYQDLGYASPGATPPCPAMPPPSTNTGPLFVDPNAINPDICDSKGALAFTSAALHDHLGALHTPDTVLANSMGAAIARGWLAIAQLNGNGDKSLAHADSVVFLQGAQAGSWAALAGQAIASAPVVGPIARRISQLAHLDLDRPGVMDVTPQSPWYFSVNPFGVPANLAYYNFYSNLLVNFQVHLLFFTLNMGSFNTGDLVMLPGSDDPTDLPLLGGAKFLPGGQQTANRHEYAVNGQVNVNPADLAIPPLLVRDVVRLASSPINHFNFGSNVGTIGVPSCAPGAPMTTVANEVFRLLQNPKTGCASAKLRLARTAITTATRAQATAPAGGHAGRSSAGDPTQLQAPYVARARTGDPVLTVQLQAGVRSTGQFRFTVANTGTWTGVVGVSRAGKSAIVHLRGDVNAEFTANGSNKPVAATVRMEGTINLAHNSATVSIRATRPGISKSTHYLINNNPRPSLRKAPPAARLAGALIQARHWAKLYKMAASEITSRFTEEQFVKLLNSQNRQKVTNVAPSGTGTFSMNSGLTYFTQKFTFTTAGTGQVVHHTSDIVMVWENKAWRFVGTTASTA